MMWKVIVLCGALQSIAGAKIPNLEIEHQSIESRIVGGRDAAEGEAPYQCSLQRMMHYCGCAILSAEYIITAAHCLDGKSTDTVKIVVGTNEWSSGVEYKPKKFIIHEKFNVPAFAHDVGLIQLQTPIEFNEKTQPIKLSRKFIEAGMNLKVTGWGFTSVAKSSLDSLQVLNVTSISYDECKEKAIAHNSSLCTLSPRGKGICNGDSGGPLVYNNELVGLVSWVSYECATARPDGYARISYLYDWVEEKMNSS